MTDLAVGAREKTIAKEVVVHKGPLPDSGWGLAEETGTGASIHALSSSCLPFTFNPPI